MTTISPTPGHLFANIPGILGYYPQESLVLMCFLPSGGGAKKKLGPVIRLDLWRDEAITGVGDALYRYDPEFLLAFIITQAVDSPQVRAVATQLRAYGDSSVFPAPVTSCWVSSEIFSGNPYQLVFDLNDPQFDDVRRYGRGWRKGTIEHIAASASCTALLEEGDLPEVDRDSAVRTFELYPHLGVAAARRNARRAIRQGHRLLSRIQSGSGDISEELESIGALCRAVEDSPPLAGSTAVIQRAAALLSDSDLRDCLVMVFAEHRVAARLVCLEVARSHTGRVRANALCLFALCSFNSPASMRGYHALQVALREDPQHRLTTLLLEAYVRGNVSGILAAAQRGSARAREGLNQSA